MIPDAPYIREAETLGMPPYDEPDFSDQIKTLKEADKEIDNVIDILLDVECGLEGSIYEHDLRELIESIENIGCDIRQEIARVKGIA